MDSIVNKQIKKIINFSLQAMITFISEDISNSFNTTIQQKGKFWNLLFLCCLIW